MIYAGLGFDLPIGWCALLIAMSAWMNVFLRLALCVAPSLDQHAGHGPAGLRHPATRGSAVADRRDREPVHGSDRRAGDGVGGRPARPQHDLSGRAGSRGDAGADPLARTAALVRGPVVRSAPPLQARHGRIRRRRHWSSWRCMRPASRRKRGRCRKRWPRPNWCWRANKNCMPSTDWRRRPRTSWARRCRPSR